MLVFANLSSQFFMELYLLAFIACEHAVNFEGWSTVRIIPTWYFKLSTENVLRCGKLCERQGQCAAVTFDKLDRMCYMHLGAEIPPQSDIEDTTKGRYLFKKQPSSQSACDRNTQIALPSARPEEEACHDIEKTTASTQVNEVNTETTASTPVTEVNTETTASTQVTEGNTGVMWEIIFHTSTANNAQTSGALIVNLTGWKTEAGNGIILSTGPITFDNENNFQQGDIDKFQFIADFEFAQKIEIRCPGTNWWSTSKIELENNKTGNIYTFLDGGWIGDSFITLFPEP